MWEHYTRNLILIVILAVIVMVLVIKSRPIQPIRGDNDALAVWRAQREAFFVSLPFSAVYDSEVAEIFVIGKDVFRNIEIYKIQLSQSRITGDSTLEYTVGVDVNDRITFLLPLNYNAMIIKERTSIAYQSQALKLAETYVNFTSDFSPISARHKNMNQRLVINDTSRIPRNDLYTIPAGLDDIINEPKVLASGTTQFKVKLYTWETSTRNIELWDMSISFSGAVSFEKSIVSPNVGAPGA